MTRRLLLAAAVTGIFASPALLCASGNPWDVGIDASNSIQKARDNGLTLNPYTTIDQDNSNKQAADATSSSNSFLTLDDAAGAGGFASRIHGFGELKFATAYMTPRGVVVENQGLVVQPLAGIVFDLYQGNGGFIKDISAVVGIWSSIHSHHPGSDMWNECDFFGTLDTKFLDKWDFAVTYGVWTYPGTPDNNPGLHTQQEVDGKLGYDDSDMLIKGFAFNPYADLFYDAAGHEGEASFTSQSFKTVYLELGMAPTYTFHWISELPITLSMPTYFSFGDSSFWGDASPTDKSRSNLGVFSTGLKASVPLKFIPSGFGNWNAFVGITYLYECNAELVNLSDVSGSGHEHNREVGYCGVGFGF